MVRNVVKVLALCALSGLIGCGADDDDGTAGGGAPGGGSAATGAGIGGGMVMAGAGSGVAGTTVAGTSGSAGSAGSAGSMAMFVPGSATWSAVYQEVLVDQGCSGGPLCHGGSAGAAGGLAMGEKDPTYDLLMMNGAAMNLPGAMAPNCKDSGKKRVAPGDPMNSLLYLKISTLMPVCGASMPPGGTLIDAAKLMQVRMWIMNGAKED